MKYEILEGMKIGFIYKGGRLVKGSVISISKKTCVLKLQTDYIGKNEEWFVGETKAFNLSEMRNIKFYNQQKQS